MSTRVASLIPTLTDTLFGEIEEQDVALPSAQDWDLERFAEEQLRFLVGRIFSPGVPHPARQVVVTGIERNAGVAGLVMRIAETLTQYSPGVVCVVNAESRTESEACYGRTAATPSPESSDALRRSSRQIADRIWHLPCDVFLGADRPQYGSRWQERLKRLRREFDYSLVVGPPVERSGQSAFLGNLADGVILVLRARTTRKLSAQRAKAMLKSAHARFLGAVLVERTFPIPEKIYRSL